MLKALLAVARQIALAHDRWRSHAAPRRPMLVELAVLRERLERVRAENDLLRARLRRIPSRSRPHYRPFERLAILWHAARHGMSVHATARAFIVSVQTILNWRRDVATKTGRTVHAKTPVNRLPDLVAEIARRLKREWPQWGPRRIAGVLARSVRGPLVAKHPGHVWLLDFTKVGGRFRSVAVAAVIDGFSRKVVGIAVAPGEPSAALAVNLVKDAVRRFGAPRHLVTDHGPQLTAPEFIRAIARLGIRHRHGAVHRHGSLALIERFWKSMKVEFANGLVLYRPLATIQTKLIAYAEWFNEHRPHQGLAQRTPDEVYFAKDTRAKVVPLHAILDTTHLAGDRSLPVLSLRRAA